MRKIRKRVNTRRVVDERVNEWTIYDILRLSKSVSSLSVVTQKRVEERLIKGKADECFED